MPGAGIEFNQVSDSSYFRKNSLNISPAIYRVVKFQFALWNDACLSIRILMLGSWDSRKAYHEKYF